MSFMSGQKLKELKLFTEAVTANPSILNNPELSFFKDFIESFGGSLPPDLEDIEEEEDNSHGHSHSHGHGGHSHSHGHGGHSHSHGHGGHDHDESEEEEEDEDDDFDDMPPLDDDDEQIPDAVEDPQPEDPDILSGDSDAPLEDAQDGIEVTDDMFEIANNKKMEAMNAYREKDYDNALKLYTEAIKNNPSGILYASRAQVLVDMKKPNAAIRDADHAVKIAPDSAKGYKIRGKAKRLLGDYENALKDIQTGQKLDWDENNNKLESELKPRVEIIVANKKKKDEVEKKRAEAAKKKSSSSSSRSRPQGNFGGMPGMGGMGGMPGMGGMGGMPGGLPPDFINKMMSDPEIMMMMSDPAVMAKMQTMMSDPSAASQMQNDPAMQKLFSKLNGMM